VTRRFKTPLKRAGLSEPIRFHDLRHASATALVRAGVHAKTVSARLGHTQIGITMDLYAHAMQEMDAEAAD
jgi:integrase